jgi:hypothetical protein
MDTAMTEIVTRGFDECLAEASAALGNRVVLEALSGIARRHRRDLGPVPTTTRRALTTC